MRLSPALQGLLAISCQASYCELAFFADNSTKSTEKIRMDQTVDHLNHKLDNMKIDSHKHGSEKLQVPTTKDVLGNVDQHIHPIPTTDSLKSSGSIASSEGAGDLASLYGTRDEYPETVYVAAPNSFFSSHGVIYSGSPSPVPNMQGYIPYSTDGVHYHNPVMDYHYLAPSIYGSVASGIQYPIQGNNGYLYGTHVYQYPAPAAYYHQALGEGQFFPSPQGLSAAGGVVMIDTQDPGQTGVVLPNGLTNGYSGTMPNFPMSMVSPSIVSEKEVVPVAVPYPSSQTLRASAPAWIEPTTKWKDTHTRGNLVGKPRVPEPSGQITSAQSNKFSSLNPTSPDGIASKSTSSVSASDVISIPGRTDTNADSCFDGDHQQSQGCEPVNKQCVPIDTWVSKIRGQLAPSPIKDLRGSYGILNKGPDSCLPCGEQFNSSEFVTEYDDAKHFIIKSYSEDNVVKSIQYGVWASTPNGNKKLDEAYQDAQRRAAASSSRCPVFLFFSVNGSRQFCGVAEMTGPVNHSRTMDFWEQHKWSGSFPLKWHIIKDLPNSQLRRIILENNENKPVTNSRDTQEVYLQQGLEMLSIFKSYPLRTSILDEFPWFSTPKPTQDAKVHHWPSQSFSRTGEHLVKDENDPDALKAAKVSSPVPKVHDNGPKESYCLEKKEVTVAAKTVEIPGPDSREEARAKENNKALGKGERSTYEGICADISG